ncbi:MAG: hypothetical protein EXR28_11695 [Betaproteobacteria bacterium]|nr:hypothetical protein [Betaproteobacteria bacterium]
MAAWSLVPNSIVPRAVSWLGKIVTLVMLGLLGWVGAHIFWDLATPATPEPAITVDTDVARISKAIAARHLFGDAPAPLAGKVSSHQRDPASLKLHGVIAPEITGNRAGPAAVGIISVEGRPAAPFRIEQEILPGIHLRRVLKNSVEIDRDGKIERLSMPERGKT